MLDVVHLASPPHWFTGAHATDIKLRYCSLSHQASCRKAWRENSLYHSICSPFAQFLIRLSMYTHVKPINSNYWPTPGSLFLLALLFHPHHHANTKRSSEMCQESGHYCLLAKGDWFPLMDCAESWKFDWSLHRTHQPLGLPNFG